LNVIFSICCAYLVVCEQRVLCWESV
jgi:hypothetical protein